MPSINIQEEITKEISSLQNKTDIEEIKKITNKIIIMLSIKFSINEMKEKEEKNELNGENDEENIILFQNLIRKNFRNILEYLTKELS